MIVGATMAGKGVAQADLDRCLVSLRPVVDFLFVLDTGISKDIVLGADVITKQWTWQDDYAAARNELLHRAGQLHGVKWIVMLDSDEEFTCADPLALKHYLSDLSGVDAVVIDHFSNSYSQARIFSRGTPVRFSRKTHEAPDTLNHKWTKTDKAVFTDFEKTPEQYKAKFERDLAILMTEQEDGRTLFYRAESLKGLGRKREAVENYLACADKSTWPEEQAWSIYQAAILVQPENAELAVVLCQRGMKLRPDYPEFPWFIAFTEYTRGRFQWGECWAQMALSLSYLPDRSPRAGFRYPFAKQEGPEQILRLARERMAGK